MPLHPGTIANALASAIAAVTVPPGSTATVMRQDCPEVDTLGLAGLLVAVVPMGAEFAQGARSGLGKAYVSLVLVVERYAAAGVPDSTWVDGRLGYAQAIVDALVPLVITDSDSASGYAEFSSADWPVVSDPSELLQRKMFWAELVVRFACRGAN